MVIREKGTGAHTKADSNVMTRKWEVLRGILNTLLLLIFHFHLVETFDNDAAAVAAQEEDT